MPGARPTTPAHLAVTRAMLAHATTSGGRAGDAPTAPWEQPRLDYECGRFVYQPDEDGSVGTLLSTEVTARRGPRAWAEPDAEVLVELGDCDVRCFGDEAAAAAILTAIERATADPAVRERCAATRARRTGEHGGVLFLDNQDLFQLPLRACRGQLPFDGVWCSADGGLDDYDFICVWHVEKLRVVGRPHRFEVREALHRGANVPGAVLRDHMDLLDGLRDQPQVFRLPGVQDALLTPLRDVAGAERWWWLALAHALLRWSPDRPTTALALATHCPDLAIDLFARLVRRAPDLLTREVVQELLLNGNAETRARAATAITFIR